MIRPFLSLPDKLAVLPGRDNPLRVQITNPTSSEATFSVAISADSPAITLTTQPSDSRLAAGQSVTLATNARLTDPTAGAAGGVITVSLRPSTGGPAGSFRRW